MSSATRVIPLLVGPRAQSRLPEYFSFSISVGGTTSLSRLYPIGLTLARLQTVLKANFSLMGPVQFGLVSEYNFRLNEGVVIDRDDTGVFKDLPSVNATSSDRAWIKFANIISGRIANLDR